MVTDRFPDFANCATSFRFGPERDRILQVDSLLCASFGSWTSRDCVVVLRRARSELPIISPWEIEGKRVEYKENGNVFIFRLLKND